MAISSRILVLSVLGFLTILATATTTTKAQATSTLSMSSALARRFLSTSAPSGESESPPYNSPTVGSKPSPDNNMPPVTMPDSGPRSQSSGGMQPKKFGKGSCKSWRQKLGEVHELISTMGSIAKIFKGKNNNNNNNNNNNDDDGDDGSNNKDNNNNGYGSNNDNNNDDNNNNDNGNNNSNDKNGGYDSDMTIMDALMSDSNDGYTSLAREAITSLLNAYTYKGFPYTPNQVRHLFNAAYYGSPGDVAKQATMFQEANEQLL